MIERVAAAVDVPPDRVVLVSAGRGAQDLERQDPPLGDERAPRRRRARAPARDEPRPEAAPRPRPPPRRRCGPSSRAPFAALYALWLALTLPVVILPLWLLTALVPSRRLAATLSRVAMRAVLRLLGCRLTAEGLERLPPRGPLVLASNHASYSDIAALVALLPKDVRFVAKTEVLRYPVVGTFARRAGHLTVDRWDAQQSVADADQVARALRQGESVLFFPEGTFVAATGLRPFRLGAFKSAAEAGAPVVPLALRGSRRILRGDWGLPHPGHIHLWVGRARGAGRHGHGLAPPPPGPRGRHDRRALRRAAPRPRGRRAGATRVVLKPAWLPGSLSTTWSGRGRCWRRTCSRPRCVPASPPPGWTCA